MLDLTDYTKRMSAGRFCVNGKPPIWGPIAKTPCLPAGSWAHPTNDPSVTAVARTASEACAANGTQGAIGNAFLQQNFQVPQFYLDTVYTAADVAAHQECERKAGLYCPAKNL